MFIVTNRNIVDEDGTDFGVVGDVFNAEGPNRLRMLEATKKGRNWNLRVLPDKLTEDLLTEAGIDKPTNGDPVFASEYLFRKTIASAKADQQSPKHIVFFVHGFNNTLEDVVVRCDGLAKNFGVEVVAFSWPANGGITGAASYLDDKRDAQSSVVAFDRALDRARELLQKMRESVIESITKKLAEKVPVNSERFRELLAVEAQKHCPIRATLLLHSMGNYLLERTMKSTALRGHLPLFENILLCAADVNNLGHEEWVDRLQVRNRLYVAINESDNALRASRMKGGGRTARTFGPLDQ